MRTKPQETSVSLVDCQTMHLSHPWVKSAVDDVVREISNTQSASLNQRSGFIYVWVNNVNGHCYVGQTINFKQRTISHFAKSSRCSVFKKAIDKYGKRSFTPVVRGCSASSMSDLERALISTLRSSNVKLYNLTDGGSGPAFVRSTQEQRHMSREVALRTWTNPVVKQRRIDGMRKAGSVARMYGTHAGGKNPSAKLDVGKVCEIRARYSAGGVTLKELAVEYGVAFCNINKIVKNLTWKITVAETAKPYRNMFGESNRSAKLTAEKVAAIRERYSSGGITQSALAKDVGVCPGTISAIIQNLIWRNVA